MSSKYRIESAVSGEVRIGAEVHKTDLDAGEYTAKDAQQVEVFEHLVSVGVAERVEAQRGKAAKPATETKE